METRKELQANNIREIYIKSSLLSKNPFSESSIENLFQFPIPKNTENYLKILNQSENIIQEAQKIIPKIHNSEQWSEICIYASAFRLKKVEDLWIMGLEKFNHSQSYISHIISFYLSEQKYHKALTYIQKNGSNRESFLAGIVASFELAQYHMVIDYYQKLNPSDQNSLNEEMINQVAYAAMQTNHYPIAENLYKVLVHKKGGKPIPSLKESLISQFGSETKMNSWASALASKIQSKKNLNEIPISNWVLYGNILMHQEKYNDALNILLKARTSYSNASF